MTTPTPSAMTSGRQQTSGQQQTEVFEDQLAAISMWHAAPPRRGRSRPRGDRSLSQPRAPYGLLQVASRDDRLDGAGQREAQDA